MSDLFLKKLGQALRLMRQSKGMTQEELAEEANLHQNYIGRIERGLVNPGIKNLCDIFYALELQLNDILQIEPKGPNNDNTAAGISNYRHPDSQ